MGGTRGEGTTRAAVVRLISRGERGWRGRGWRGRGSGGGWNGGGY